MRKGIWPLSLLLLGATSAFGANYRMKIGVDCDFAAARLLLREGLCR